LHNYCDSLQAAISVYNGLFPTSQQSWAFVNLMELTFWSFGYSSGGQWISNSLQSWDSVANGCGISCPHLINCTLADSILNNFYTTYPEYTVHAPGFLWAGYLNSNNAGQGNWYTTKDWTTMLGCCGISVPVADTVNNYCDSLRDAIGAFNQQYPGGNNWWTFTGSLNNLLGYQHYDSASGHNINNTDLYWVGRIKGCGLGCPGIVNCTTVSNLMDSFKVHYPQYDSAAPTLTWVDYLNQNNAGIDNAGNVWTYETEQWLALLACCNITPPAPVALGTYCDTIHAILATIPGIGTVNVNVNDINNALNSNFYWEHYDSASGVYISNTLPYYLGLLKRCGDSCIQIVGCDSINAAISQLSSFQISPDSGGTYSIAFIEGYLGLRFQNLQLDPVSWRMILQCCAPGSINFSDTVLSHCDTTAFIRFALQYNLPLLDSCYPSWVYNYMLSQIQIGTDSNIYQLCNDLTNCNIRCLPYCSSPLITSCDSVNSVYYMYRQLLALEQSGGLPASDPNLLQMVYSLLYGQTPSVGQIVQKIMACDTGDCIIVTLPLSQAQPVFDSYTGCIPVRVFTTGMNLNAGVNYPYSQWCTLFTHCGDTCPAVCDSAYTLCDSVKEAADLTNRAIATSGGTSDTGAILSMVFSAYFYSAISAQGADSMIAACKCDSFQSVTSVNNDTVCPGSIATLTVTYGTNYLWNTGDTTPSIHRFPAGTYTVTATNSSGCSAIASGTVVISSTPLPPATPTFLSECSDSTIDFIFDYVTAWGDNLQWSYNSSFSPAYTEYPDYDSYIINPFTISVPGDTSITVWLRTITSPAGCRSDSVSVILETDRLPLQRNIYAIDTLVPQDSAATVVVPNSQPGVNYTLQSGYLVLGSAMGNGDTLYIQTPPVSSLMIVDVFATDTAHGCPRHLYEGRYRSYSRVDSTSDIYVTIDHSRPVQACQPDTLYITVTNNTLLPIDTVIVNLYINNPNFSAEDTILNNRIGNGSSPHTLPIVSSSGSILHVQLDTIPADSTWSFSMVLFTNCPEIPNSVPTSGGIVIPKSDSTNWVYVRVSGPNDTVGINNQANVTAVNPYFITLDSILYPIFDVDLHNTTAFDSVGGIYTYQSGSLNEYNGCVSQGDTFTRRSYFINKGLASFTGGFRIRDSMTCAGLTLIKAKIYYSNKTVTLSSADHAMLLGSGYEHNLSDDGDTVGISSDLILEETFVVPGCLGSACESKIIMTWGCDTTNLCKTAIPTPYTYITHNCKQPMFLISRILPVSNYNGSPDAYWDSTCINTSTKWEFEIQNADTSATTTLNNVHVVLNKVLAGSYSFINWSSFRMGFADPIYGDSLPGSDSLSYKLTLLTAHTSDSLIHYTSACLSNPNIDSPILSLDMRIATLKRGDKFFISFYTYQCCPSDSELFNHPFTMNHWTLNAYGFYCGESAYDSVVAQPLDKPTAHPPYYAATIIYDSDQPDAISPYAHNQGNDFGLTQVFTPSISTMNRDETDTFCINNLALNAVAFTDYQLLFQHGYNNGASGPSFRLIVDISTQTGLWVNPAGRIHISGQGYNWPGTVLSNDSSFTEVAFDVAALALADPAISGSNGAAAFQSFFNGSNLCFPLTSFCPAMQPTVGVQVRTYIEPKLSLGCDTCKIPLAEIGAGIHVLCPGCITPGIQIVSSTIERMNFGLPDTNDMGYADGTIAITPSNYQPYFSNGNIKRGIAMVGDTLRSYTLEDFDDGDATKGFTYAGWNSFWTAHGDTNAYFRYLFRDVNMPYSRATDMNVRLIMDTLYYIPAGDTASYVIPLPIDANYAVHNGDNFIFRLSIDSLRALLHNDSISFKPGDKYRFCTYYVICGNFSIPTGSDNLQYQCATSVLSYYTTPPYSAFVLPQYEVGDYFGTHVDTTGHISNDSIVTPETSIYYLCVAAAPLFYDCYVHYKANYYDFYDFNNTMTRCIKPLYMGISAEVLGPYSDAGNHYYDNFPYEFRPIPCLASGDDIIINDSTLPYAFMIKSLGGCYTMAPSYTATSLYIHPTTAGGQSQISEDTVTSGFYSISAPPYERYSFPLLFVYANAHNIPPASDRSGPLRIGDEYFQQQLQFLITAPVCAGCPDTLYDNTDSRFEAIVVPPLSACDSVIADTFFSNAYNSVTGGGLVLHRPQAELFPQPLSAIPLADTGSFMVPQVLNITHDHPDNLYVYIDTSMIPPCLSIDSIVSIDSTTSAPKAVYGRGVKPLSIGRYLLFDIGFSLAASSYQKIRDSIYYNATDSLKFFFHWNCCPANFDSALYLNLPFMLNWQCVNFPTTLPDSACHIPVPDNIPLLIQPAAFDNIPVVMQPDTFSSCDTLRFSVRIQSADYGPIHGITNILNMPPGLNIVPGSLTVSYQVGNHNTTVHRTLSGDSVSIPPIVLHFQDTILLSFAAVPTCSYTGDAPMDIFYGISFCGTPVSPVVAFHPMAYLGNLCGPFFNAATVSNEHCYGDSSGQIFVSAYGSDTIFNFSWPASIGSIDTDANDFTATNVHAGTYIITVTDPKRNCSQHDTITVTQPGILSGTTAFANIIPGNCFNDYATVYPSGGTPAYTYHWSGGSFTNAQTDSGMAGGTVYTVTITDANGCTATLMDTLPTPPVVMITGDSAICSGSTAILNAGAGFNSYAWSTNANAEIIYPTSAGTYYVTVSLNGCLASDSFKLTVFPVPSPVVTIAGFDLCSNDTALNYTFSPTYRLTVPTYTLNQGPCTQVCSGSLSRIAVLLSNPGDAHSVTIVGGTDTLLASFSSDTLIYDIRWGTAGQGIISVNEISPAGCHTQVSFCIDILPSPVAGFGIIGMNNADTINVCSHSTINFSDSSFIDTANINAGSGNIAWHWNFGDDSTSTQQSPSHIYSLPGTYTVTLTASSSCGCTGTDSMLVVVTETSPIDIECPSILCSGGSATYTALGCSDISWGAIGGIITSHTGNSVTITWNSVGSSGFGYVIDTPVSCGTCHAPSSVKIPVITQNAFIIGPHTICPNSPTYYSLPLWPGGVYHWSIVNGSPNPSASIFSSLNNDYNVLVKATAYGTFTLKVKYTDPVAGCSDSSYITINVAGSVVDSANPSVGCTGNAVTFTLSNSAISRWNIVSPNGGIDTFGGVASNSVTYTPDSAGNYSVYLASPNVCVGKPLIYHVDQTPSLSGSVIKGPDSVCRNTPYTYQDSIPAPAGVKYVWSLPNAGDGVIVGSNIGNSVIVKWTKAAYAATCILKLNAASTVDTNCVDTASKMYVVHIIEPDSAFRIPLTVCANSVSSAINAVSHAQDYYTWSFTPANLASCVSGYDHSIHPLIQFNNVTTPTTVTVTLTVTRCNITIHKNSVVTIIPVPTVSLTADTPFCPLSTSIFIAHPSATWPHTTFTWTLSNGDTVNTGTSTMLNYAFLDTGYYWIRVTAHFADTCLGNVTSAKDSFRIRGCGSGIGGSVGSVGLGGIGGTGGTGGSPCTITFGTPVINVYCNDSASVSQTYSPSGTLISQSWTLDSASYFLIGTPSMTTITAGSTYHFRVRHSGYYPLIYTVTLVVASDTMICSTLIIVTVPLHEGYISTLQCNSTNNGYVLHLTDNTDYVGPRPIYLWSTIPSVLPPGPDTGISITSGPLTNPIYRVSHTLYQGSLVCQQRFDVIVPTLPTAAFTYVDTPLSAGFNRSPICEGFSIRLQPTQPLNPLWTYHWHDYHDQADIIYYNPAKEYGYNYIATHGGHFTDSISLHVTDAYGCSASIHSQRFTIFENLIAGNVSSATGLVQPENAAYLCPSGGSVAFDYQITSFPPGTISSWDWYNTASPNLPFTTPTLTLSGPDGRYLCIVTDINGCQDISGKAGVIQTLPMPPLTITGPARYCAGDTVILKATLVDSMAYSWSLPGHTAVSGNVYSISGLAAGSYTVTLTYTYTFANSGTPSKTCSENTTFNFTVDSVPIVVAVIGSVTCSPYTVNLNAYGTLSSGYSWSNHATTQNTQVSAGGDYRVVLISPGGCQSHYDVLVPDDPSLLIQYAPYGCYTYGCTAIDSAGVKLTGPPNTQFAAWAWNLSGTIIPGQVGYNSAVSPYIIHMAGDYSLTLYDVIGSYHCISTSPLMQVSASPVPCPVLCTLGAIGEELKCTGDSNIEIRVADGSYSYDTYNLTTPSGTFIGVTPPQLGPPGHYTFIYATLVPNLGVYGSIFVVITVSDSSGSCQDTLHISLRDCKYGMSRREKDSTVLGKVLLMPNPASDLVRVVYSTGPTNDPLPAGETLTLTLTNISGQLIEQQALYTVSGMVTINVSAMKPGTYFVTLSKNNRPINTDKLEVLSR
jgi:PKD repeat protein